MSRTEGTAVVRGKRIFYRQQTSPPGSKFAVLLIHGNTGSSLWFDRVMNVPGMDMVAPDMPNFGNSDALEESDIDLYAEYISGFCDEILPGRQLVVVGHSLGGAVAMSLALSSPERIAGLMLVDSCPPGGLVTPEEHYPAIERYRTNPALLRAALAAVTPHLADGVFLDELVEDARRMSPAAFVGNARALARFDCESRSTRLGSPVLVVWGSEDIIVSREMALRTANAFPRGELLTLSEVGHSLMVEDPNRFITVLNEFVGNLMR